MEAKTFDAFARALGLGDLGSRRKLLGLSLGGVLGALGLGLGELDAVGKNKKKRRRRRRKRKQRKKRKKNKQQPIFNDFGCVDVGNFCQNRDQCCSGICQDKACQAHDQSTCTAGQHHTDCGGETTSCETSAGQVGSCATTTGNAGYCRRDGGGGGCFPCSKDTDCQRFCGPQAACIICEGECASVGGTACVGPGACKS